MTDGLKPCPFCGGKAHMHIGLMEFVDGEVQCECGGSSGNHPTAVQAITAWNTRSADAKIARLEAENERMRGVCLMHSPNSYQTLIDNLKPEKRVEALRTLIEIGGIDRDLMIEFRQQFLALTKGEEHERSN